MAVDEKKTAKDEKKKAYVTVAEDKKKKADAANAQTIDSLIKMVQDIQDVSEKGTTEARDKACKTFNDLRYMIWIAFILGLALIGVAIYLFVFQERTLEVLGLSSLGVADWIALFVYKPMDRLQKANADYVQQFVILRGWAAFTNLHFLAMDSTDRESQKEAATSIQNGAIEAARSFAKYIE